MNIPFFNYQSLFKENEKKFIEIFSDIGRRGAYIMQDDLSDWVVVTPVGPMGPGDADAIDSFLDQFNS